MIERCNTDIAEGRNAEERREYLQICENLVLQSRERVERLTLGVYMTG